MKPVQKACVRFYEQIGDQVTSWEIGDRVAAMSVQPVDQNGTYVELINLEADLVARVPDHLPLDHVATVPRCHSRR